MHETCYTYTIHHDEQLSGSLYQTSSALYYSVPLNVGDPWSRPTNVSHAAQCPCLFRRNTICD